jgi:hypothetical protein
MILVPEQAQVFLAVVVFLVCFLGSGMEPGPLCTLSLSLCRYLIIGRPVDPLPVYVIMRAFLSSKVS